MVILPDDGSAQGSVDFVQCVHCGRHWPVGASVAGIVSGKLDLGFCHKCDGLHCGAECQECTPYEAQIEAIERGIILGE